MKIALFVGHSKLKNGYFTSADGRKYGGVLEYEYCKKLAPYVKKWLELAGHEVDLIVCPELVFESYKEEYNYKVPKANSGDYDLIIELHLNACTNHNKKGTETLYYCEKGKAIALRVCKKLQTLFTNRGAKQRKDLYILRDTKPVAILIEVFFCDSVEDSVKGKEYNTVGKLIAEGVHGGAIKEPVKEEPKEEPKKETMEIPCLKGYKGFSIVDGLKAFGYQSSFSYRKKLWKAIGKTTTYKGTAVQNTTLLNYLRGL